MIKEITIKKDDSFKMILSKYGALALDKQENLSQLIGETEGELDIEKATITFGEMEFQVQVLGFYRDDIKQWSWAWDSEDIFGRELITSAIQIKAIGDEFNIKEFTSPIINSDFNDCHTLAMVSASILDADSYYAASQDGIDIFVLINSDMIKESDSVEKFRDTFYTFQKNFNVYPKTAFEGYTKLKGYDFKPHDDFAVAKIGESRIIVGFTERGNVTHIQMFLEED